MKLTYLDTLLNETIETDKEVVSASIYGIISHTIFETIWTMIIWNAFGIDILLPKTKPILIGSAYRPPSQHAFLEHFENVIKQMDYTQETYIIGDINICVQNRITNLGKTYSELLKHSGFSQIIKEPTRIESKKSIIDHIICSSDNKITQSGVLPLAISDHLATFCTRKAKQISYNFHNTMTIRSMKKYSKQAFCGILEQSDWSPVYSSSDVDTVCSSFQDIFYNSTWDNRT